MLNIVLIAGQNDETANLCRELKNSGFHCSIVDSDEAKEYVAKHTVNILLIEFNGSDEIEVLCRHLHDEKNLPVIAIVPLEKLDSLGEYVDDFVIVPYVIKEIAARINRLTKKESDSSTEQIRTAGIVIDPEKYEVYVDGKLVSLTFKEYELLKFLTSHPGRVFTRDTLLNQVWSEDYFGGDRTVDVHIRRLRSKIEDASHIYIETVRNIGYRFIKK